MTTEFALRQRFRAARAHVQLLTELDAAIQRLDREIMERMTQREALRQEQHRRAEVTDD